MYDTEYVLSGYVDCALWSTCSEDGIPLDERYMATDFSEAARERMYKDVRGFLVTNRGTLERLAEKFPAVEASDIGHNLWLTRNGHGAGFWDRGWGVLGDALSEAAKALGECHIVETRGELETVTM